MHEVLVKNEGEAVRGAPHFLRSMPKSKKDYEGIEPCAVGSTVEVLINPHHAARPELLEVSAIVARILSHLLGGEITQPIILM